MIDDELAMDFKVITTAGAGYIIRLAFEYAKKNNHRGVIIITKANA